MSQKKKWSAKDKLKIALEAIKEDVTINAVCQRHKVAPSQVHAWKKLLRERGNEIFDNMAQSRQEKEMKKQALLPF